MTGENKNCYTCDNKKCNITHSCVRQDVTEHYEVYDIEFDCVNHNKWEPLLWREKHTEENKMNRFKSGDIVQHFKRTMLTETELKDNPTAYLYEVIGYGKHTETHEEYVVYKTLYSLRDVHFGEIYIRPKEMFESLVDIEKYPNAKQLYRFEVVKL